MSDMPQLALPALAACHGRVALPGSKSLSNRALLLAALAEGETRIDALLESDDTRHMRRALDALGVAIDGDPDRGLRVRGCGGRFAVPAAKLSLGNAGTAVRTLTAVLGVLGGDYRIDGVARMRERPIGDLLDALRPLGAQIDCAADEGFLPLRIGAFADSGAARVAVRGDVSSQYLTGLLIALPLLGRPVALEVAGELISKPYVDMTLDLMARFGVLAERDGYAAFRFDGAQRYRSPGRLRIEADASSASYFLAAGAIGGRVRVEGVGRRSVQGDVRFADALAAIGARIEWGDDWIEAERPASGRLAAFDADFNHIPDAAMTLAVTALFCAGPCRLRNIASWRVKETDRIAAMHSELLRLGAVAEQGDDWLAVNPAERLRAHTAIHTYDDHRIAMSFALATLAGLPLTILDPGCTAKTFPGFFDAFGAIAEELAP